nr:hypothetical protein [Morchella crassipes]
MEKLSEKGVLENYFSLNLSFYLYLIYLYLIYLPMICLISTFSFWPSPTLFFFYFIKKNRNPPPPRAPTPPLSWGPPTIAISVSLSYGGEMHLPPPLRPLSTFFFSIFNWKKKGGPRAISLLLGGARYARPPQQKEEGEASPPRRGGCKRGAAPPLSLRSSWVAPLLGGGPHENPWRPPYGASKGARGVLHPLTSSREGAAAPAASPALGLFIFRALRARKKRRQPQPPRRRWGFGFFARSAREKKPTASPPHAQPLAAKQPWLSKSPPLSTTFLTVYFLTSPPPSIHALPLHNPTLGVGPWRGRGGPPSFMYGEGRNKWERKGAGSLPPPTDPLFPEFRENMGCGEGGLLARERGAENTKAAPLPLGHPSWTPPLLHFIPPPPLPIIDPPSLLIFFFAYFYLCYYYYKKYEREGGGGTWGGGIFGGGVQEV